MNKTKKTKTKQKPNKQKQKPVNYPENLSERCFHETVHVLQKYKLYVFHQ